MDRPLSPAGAGAEGLSGESSKRKSLIVLLLLYNGIVFVARSFAKSPVS
jgi:hypothetical protein